MYRCGTAAGYWRRIGLSLAGAAILSLGGCEMFATSPLTRAPAASGFAGMLPSSGSEARFRLEEGLWRPGGREAVLELPPREIVLAWGGDSAVGGDSFRRLHVEVHEDGEAEESFALLVRADERGVLVGSAGRRDGMRLHALKPAALDDMGLFQILPPAFFLGERWSMPAGELEAVREITGLDTLEHAGGLEEAWIIAEEVAMDATRLSRGTYWYGASGLLRSEQRWESFPWRSSAGRDLGPAELRRSLRKL